MLYDSTFQQCNRLIKMRFIFLEKHNIQYFNMQYIMKLCIKLIY